MITYEITAQVEPELVPAYERYMQERHIPDVLGTGCFEAASFSRSTPGRYRVRYEAPHEATLDAYLEHHAAALRAHVDEVFPSGVSISREHWHVLRHWSTGAAATGE